MTLSGESAFRSPYVRAKYYFPRSLYVATVLVPIISNVKGSKLVATVFGWFKTKTKMLK